MSARERFAQTRKAVIELCSIKALIMSGGEDWKPPNVKAQGVSDPTAARAIRNVDELADKLEALRKREAELEEFIGVTLGIIEAVRKGLGEDYARLLEARYIDDLPWKHISDQMQDMTRQRGHYMMNIAFDWIDSLGVARLLRGDYEL